MTTNIRGLSIVGCALVLSSMPIQGQVTRCPFTQGAGYGGTDVTKCTDAGDCGPGGTSCCLRYTCVGHPPACGQNCGEACTFTYSCGDIDGSTACGSDCGLGPASGRPELAGERARRAVAAMPASFQSPASTAATPFTLVKEIVSFQHSTKGELHRSQTVAVRSDGSRSVTETILGKVGISRSELKRSLRFADGRRVTQFLALGVKNTWPSLDEAAVAERRARSYAVEAANCLIPGWTAVGVDTIQQQPVTILSHTSDDLAWKLTVWSAPQLGCEDLRQLAYDRQTDGTFTLTAEMKTLSLRIGEPDTSLFEEPSGLREVSPLEVGQLLVRKYALPMSDKQLHDLMRLFEDSYSGRH